MTIRVLFVNHDRQPSQGFHMLLRRTGLSIETVSTAQQAHAFLAERPVDVVVWDEGMPAGSTGLRFFSELRMGRPDILRIAITSAGAPVPGVEVAHRRLTKPTAPRDLLVNIHELIAKRDSLATPLPAVGPSAVTLPSIARQSPQPAPRSSKRPEEISAQRYEDR